MLAFSLDGITSFSITPIRLVTLMGFIISLLGILAGVYALFSKLFGVTVSGWTSIILSIWILGGIQLISLGLIGEYIGKIYKETKSRPKYSIEQKIGLDKRKKSDYEEIFFKRVYSFFACWCVKHRDKLYRLYDFSHYKYALFAC